MSLERENVDTLPSFSVKKKSSPEEVDVVDIELFRKLSVVCDVVVVPSPMKIMAVRNVRE